MVWYFIGVYIIKEHYMAAWRYEISLLVLKKYFSTLEENQNKNYQSTLIQIYLNRKK